MEVRWNDVESSWVRRIGYVALTADFAAKVGPRKGLVVLEKHDGDRYLYLVDSWVVGLLMAHPSPGRAVNLLMTRKYQFKKLDPAVDLRDLAEATPV